MKARRADWMRRWHRLSGVALAAFVPAHFLTLGLAIDGANALDSMLSVAQLGPVRAAEAVFVGLLVVHLAFGCRVLLIEWEARRDNGQPANMRLVWFWPALLIAGATGLLLVGLGAG
jgi:fumarate reductase subunit D